MLVTSFDDEFMSLHKHFYGPLDYKNQPTCTCTHITASASNVSEDGEDSDGSVGNSDRQPNGSVIIKPLSAVSQLPEDCQQIEPKRFHNPVMASKIHMQMHKELKLNHAR